MADLRHVSEAPPVGIDLGTTHSLVAVFDDEGPRVLSDETGATLIPSAVAIDDTGRLVVGRPARERLTSRPRTAVDRFKPDMGSAVTRGLGPHDLDSTSLSALVLRELRELASAHLGVDVREAVVTVPAWFREPQRRATLDAARLAGLEVRRLVNEPTAAALAYGLHAGDDPVTIAVLDLGGGTFDLTVLELFDGVVDVRSSVGDARLGGEDFTDAIVQHALRRQSVVRLTPEDLGPLRLRAELAKRALTSSVEVTLELDDGELALTRSGFEGLVAPLVERMARCVREALAQAELRTAEVDEIVLVGGATRMPAVEGLVRRIFGRPPRTLPEVDHAVALGAAVQAALLRRHEAVRERVVTDVLTHSLGVSILRRYGDAVFTDRFDPVLHRGSVLPASRVSRYHTLHHEQHTVRFQVYEGEHRDARQNTLLGTLEVTDLPVSDDPDHREDLDVRFTHDTSGLLEVEATVVSTGERVGVVLERTGSELSEAERAEAEAVLARLHTHPRDLLPNRWLLERATRVVEMVSGGVRADLDGWLTAFEAALEHGDPGRIEQVRVALRERVDAVAARYELDLL